MAIGARLRELEGEREELESLITGAELPFEDLDLAHIKRQIADYVLHFESRFQDAPIEERKELVRRCIPRIEVDKENRVALGSMYNAYRLSRLNYRSLLRQNQPDMW